MLTVACVVGGVVSALGAIVNLDAYRRTVMRVWMPEVSGVVQAGDALRPGVLVDVQVPPEDAVPHFSEIAGHAWLAHVAAVPCDCSEATLNCGCVVGTFEQNAVFLTPPWRSRFPDVVPSVPYGANLLRPALATWLYRQLVFDVDTPSPPRATSCETGEAIVARP